MPVFSLLRPLVFMVDPELAHRLTIRALRLLPHRPPPAADPVLGSTVAGIYFPNPVGLAPGFDKDAEIPGAMLGMGFGSVELGTLTPLAQTGNPKPRLFRLGADDAVINRMGFNNGGQSAALERLRNAKAKGGVIGVNIGANKDSVDRIADYARGVAMMAPVASYLTVNISSPNTPGLRGLQDKAALTELLDAVNTALPEGGPPVFLKLAPDLERAEIEDVVSVVMGRVAALIIGNTTISRPPLRSEQASQQGGLSGTPLAALARQKLAEFAQATGGEMPLIAAGGIDSAEEAYARIRAGASLVQLYSALVYHGPGLARQIVAGLRTLLLRDGFASVSAAIGSVKR